MRIEAETASPTNIRRIEVLVRIRDVLETTYGVRFVYADRSGGEGVVMKKGR